MREKGVNYWIDRHPPESSSPNARAHHIVRSRDGRKFMQDVILSIRAATACVKLQAFERPILQVEWYFHEYRERDADNFQARFKYGQDALVKVGLLSKDSSPYLTVLPPIFSIKPEHPEGLWIRIWEEA